MNLLVELQDRIDQMREVMSAGGAVQPVNQLPIA